MGTKSEPKFKLSVPKFLRGKKAKQLTLNKPNSKLDASEILEPKIATKPPLFGIKTDSVSQQLFRTDKSSSNPNSELARIVAVWDMTMNEFKWPDCKFSEIIREAQASVDGKYHNDVKEVAIAQEIEVRSERKGGRPSIGLKILE